MPLRAVIFDYGMVLSAPADPVAHEELVQIFGAPAETFEAQYWAHRHAYDAGEFEGRGYWRLCAEGAGVSLTEAQVSQLIETDIRMWMSLDQAMVDWAIEVGRAGFRTGILSNIGEDLVPALLRFPWVKSFTAKIWSCRLRLAKPDPAIYHHALERLDVRAGEALFIDDRQENILTARAVGMQGVIYRTIPELHRELQQMGLAELLPPLPVEPVRAS
ncbi:MAG TPA: HAD family phosphatase [Acidisarcina sp.]